MGLKKWLWMYGSLQLRHWRVFCEYPFLLHDLFLSDLCLIHSLFAYTCVTMDNILRILGWEWFFSLSVSFSFFLFSFFLRFWRRVGLICYTVYSFEQYAAICSMAVCCPVLSGLVFACLYFKIKKIWSQKNKVKSRKNKLPQTLSVLLLLSDRWQRVPTRLCQQQSVCRPHRQSDRARAETDQFTPLQLSLQPFNLSSNWT